MTAHKNPANASILLPLFTKIEVKDVSFCNGYFPKMEIVVTNSTNDFCNK